jgi:hypothetical protein
MTTNYVSIAHLTVLIGQIVCLHNDAWFYDLGWFVSLQWVLVYCGSYICNNISCVVGFSFCTSHLLVTFLPLYIIKRRTPKSGNEGHTNVINKQMLLPPSQSRSKQVEERRHHSTFFSILCLLLSNLAHSDEDPNDQDKKRNKDFTTIDKTGWPPTYHNRIVLVYLPSPCFSFLRISGRDSF